MPAPQFADFAAYALDRVLPRALRRFPLFFVPQIVLGEG